MATYFFAAAFFFAGYSLRMVLANHWMNEAANTSETILKLYKTEVSRRRFWFDLCFKSLRLNNRMIGAAIQDPADMKFFWGPGKDELMAMMTEIDAEKKQTLETTDAPTN